jgi:hypothetical protein
VGSEGEVFVCMCLKNFKTLSRYNTYFHIFPAEGPEIGDLAKLILVFWWNWGLNSGPHVCYAVSCKLFAWGGHQNEILVISAP